MIGVGVGLDRDGWLAGGCVGRRLRMQAGGCVGRQAGR